MVLYLDLIYAEEKFYLIWCVDWLDWLVSECKLRIKMNKTRGWPRVTSLKHVAIIYMIELTAQLQSNIFWAAEYFSNKDQQSIIQ